MARRIYDKPLCRERVQSEDVAHPLAMRGASSELHHNERTLWHEQKNTPADALQPKLAVSLFCVQAFFGLGMTLGITSPSSLGTTTPTPCRSIHHLTTANFRLNAATLQHRRAFSRGSSSCRKISASSADPDAQADRLWNQAIQQQQSPQISDTLFEVASKGHLDGTSGT